MTEPQDDADALDSICDLVSAEDINEITGLTLVLRTDSSFRAGPPYDRCSWESSEGNVVVASIWARSLVSEGVASPDEWWTRNLQPLEDAVAEVRPLPAFGEHAYLATDDTTVDVLWFPAPDTYVEARVAATGWPTAQQPPPAEVERMALELSQLVVERLEPHLPRPEPEGD